LVLKCQSGEENFKVGAFPKWGPNLVLGSSFWESYMWALPIIKHEAKVISTKWG